MLNFNHARPDGSKLETVNDEGMISGNYRYFGENIAYHSYVSVSNEQIAKLFFDMWKSSEGHYRNMISPNYQEIGCGFAYANGIIYASQNFYTF